MEQPSRESEPRSGDERPPLERELAGLAELEGFASESDRAAALRAVHRRIEDPYTLSYWLWVAGMVCVAVGAARLAWWGLKAAGTPFPFPAAIGVVAGVAVYTLLYRLVVRWAARPELRDELARRGIPLGAGSNAGRSSLPPASAGAIGEVPKPPSGDGGRERSA